MKSGRLHTVYALLDPASKEIRYVGLTVDLSARLRMHNSPQQWRTKKLAEWIAELAVDGLRPDVKVLAQSGQAFYAKTLEAHYIGVYLELGCKLLNTYIGQRPLPGAEGRFGGQEWTEERKREHSRKVRAAWKRKPEKLKQEIIAKRAAGRRAFYSKDIKDKLVARRTSRGGEAVARGAGQTSHKSAEGREVH